MFHIRVLAYFGILPRLRDKPCESKFEPTQNDDCSVVMANIPAICLEEWESEEAVEYEQLPSGEVILFRRLGGFYLDDAEALLDWIWRDRKSLTILCGAIRMRGWSTLFYVLWAHVRDSPRADQLCRRLWHLLMRYTLIATHDERALALRLIHSIADRFPLGGGEYKFIPVDQVDARNILSAFQVYLTSTKEDPNIKHVYPLFALVFYSALFIGQAEVISLLDMILQHTWKMFEQNHRRDVTHKIKDAFYYGYRAIWVIVYV
ncbi:hypothetical protein RSAG8_07349, partial [Rhizoctonia solani AG-8 WAC10335]